MKLIGIKEKERKIRSRVGRILFRRDCQLLRKMRGDDEMFIMSHNLFRLFSPWNSKMLAVVIPVNSMTFNEKMNNIRGQILSREQVYKIFQLSRQFERLAQFNYESYKN